MQSATKADALETEALETSKVVGSETNNSPVRVQVNMFSQNYKTTDERTAPNGNRQDTESEQTIGLKTFESAVEQKQP